MIDFFTETSVETASLLVRCVALSRIASWYIHLKNSVQKNEFSRIL